MPTFFPCVVEAPRLKALPRPLRVSLAWACIVLFAALYFLIPGLVIASIVLGSLGHLRVSLAIACVLVALAMLPAREWPGARRFCQLFYEIFHVRHNMDAARIERIAAASVERGERYILGMHPHGIVPIQALLWSAYADQYLRTPEHGTVYGFGGMASVLFYLPILRNIMGWLTGLPATYANLKENLTHPTRKGATFRGEHPGRNLYMLPGGIAEM